MLINRNFQWGQHSGAVYLQCIHKFLHMVLILEYHILLGQNVFINLDGRHQDLCFDSMFMGKDLGSIRRLGQMMPLWCMVAARIQLLELLIRTGKPKLDHPKGKDLHGAVHRGTMQATRILLVGANPCGCQSSLEVARIIYIYAVLS